MKPLRLQPQYLAHKIILKVPTNIIINRDSYLLGAMPMQLCTIGLNKNTQPQVINQVEPLIFLLQTVFNQLHSSLRLECLCDLNLVAEELALSFLEDRLFINDGRLFSLCS